jgi:soluble lytic murein transglycosylase-like protein
MKVSDILMQKFEEIQRRIPLQMRVPVKLSFKSLLKTSMQNLKTSAGGIGLNKKSIAGNISRIDRGTMEYIETCIRDASEKHGVDSSLIRAVIKYESGFDPLAVSRAGAEGLMQLMPETARLLGVRDSFNIRENIDGGTRFLKDMLDSFDGDLELALAAYNAGPSVVRRFGGVPPYEETRNYIKNVLREYNGR